jgi:guanylate kinase
MKKARGMLIVLSGPSGVGKTTLCDRLLKSNPGICYSVSATSRPRRKGERNGREYIFLTERTFEEWIVRKKFIEYARVHGNLYGTPRKFLIDALNRGHDVLMDVDVQGGKSLMKEFPDAIMIFILPPNYTELRKRLINRRTDHLHVIRSRLKRARQELRYKKTYDYAVVNRDLNRTVRRIKKIIGIEKKNPLEKR